MGLEVLIGEVVRAPVHGRAKSFRSSSKLTRVSNISATFHDVDLTTGRPLSVLIVAGKAPDSRPKPVSLGQLGLDLNTTVLEIEGIDGGKLTTHDGIDVVVSVTGPAAAVEEISGALIGGRSSPKFIGVSCSDGLLSNFVLGEDGLDVEHSVLDEGGASVVVVKLELPVTSTGESDIVAPFGKIEEVEVVLKDDLGAREDEHCQKETNELHPSRYIRYDY